MRPATLEENRFRDTNQAFWRHEPRLSAGPEAPAANGKAASDLSSVGLIFAKQAPKTEIKTAFTNTTLLLPAGLGSFGSLQVLVCGAEAIGATPGDLPQPQAHFKLQSKNFFDLAHGQSPRWQADPPFRGGGCLPLCCPAPLRACGNHTGEAERCYGIGLKLFGFIPEPLFGMIPECRSALSRNRVHLAPDSPN